jgi:NitT/TauT family transport system permease protein
MLYWPRITGSLKRAAIWLLILLIWEAAYRTIGWRSWVFPAPSHVLDSLLGLLGMQTAFGEAMSAKWPWPLEERAQTSALLLGAMGVSALRLVAGFVFSILLGLVVGLSMWRWKSIDEFFGPLFLGLQTLPSVCWVPVAILWFGITEQAILYVLVMGSFFAIALSLRDGLRTIPPLYQRAGLMLGARGWKLYRYVLLPASLPALSSSLRQGFSFAWRSLMGAEFLLVLKAHGLGFLLQTGRDFNDVGQVVAVMAIMVIAGIAADRLAFARLEKRIHARFGLGIG